MNNKHGSKPAASLCAVLSRSFAAKSNLIFCLLFFGGVLNIVAQDYGIGERTRIYTRDITPDSVLLMADNRFATPVSLVLQIDAQNLSGKNLSTIRSIVPPHARGEVIGRFRKLDPRTPYQLSYNWRIVLGDTTSTPSAYKYRYPYDQAKSYRVSQGPGGDFSHQHSFAYDFDMPVGTPVKAAREGTVVLVKTNETEGGTHPDFTEKANYISILHPDGTIGNYFHLMHQGSAVREGQKVAAGQLIGYSGNTGLSSGPHLHFEIIRPNLSARTKDWVRFQWEENKTHPALAVGR